MIDCGRFNLGFHDATSDLRSLISDLCLVQSPRPAGHVKYHQNVTVVYPGLEFPLHERQDRARIELAVTGCFQDLNFIGNSGLSVNDEPINTLALITEISGFHRIFRVRRGQRVLFEFVIDRYDLGGAARRHKRNLE